MPDVFYDTPRAFDFAGMDRMPMLNANMRGGASGFDIMSPQINEIAPILNLGHVTPKESLAPITRTRKLFPETWLWETIDIKSVIEMHCGLYILHDTSPMQ